MIKQKKICDKVKKLCGPQAILKSKLAQLKYNLKVCNLKLKGELHSRKTILFYLLNLKSFENYAFKKTQVKSLSGSKVMLVFCDVILDKL